MNELPNQDPPQWRTSSHRASRDVIEWPLRSVWIRAVFLTVVTAISSLIVYKTIRVALATIPENSLTVAAIQKGLEYDPDNANLLHRLGVVYSFVPTELNLTEALKFMRQAVALNPHRCDFWTDLATTCDFAGDTSCSDVAFERAESLNPMLPRLQWMIANHYVLTDRLEQSFPHFRKLLETSPDDYWGPTLRLCLRAVGDPRQVFSKVIPQGKDSKMRFTFLSFLGSTGDYESAMRIWQQMINGADRTPDINSVRVFLDFLIDHNRIQDASTVWRDLQRVGVAQKATNDNSEDLIYNGKFQWPPLNTGFDWRYDASVGSDVLFDFFDPAPYKGKNCLRIEFPVGRNAAYDLLSQVVIVKPNTRYRLTAHVRSEGLTSDSGPRFKLADLGCADCASPTSDAILGTTPWHQVDVTLTTHPQTQAVRVDFWRPAGKMPPREISGTVWVDDVKLEPSGDYGLGVGKGRLP